VVTAVALLRIVCACATIALNEIDAGVFSGDLLWVNERRELLKTYVARWQRAIDAHNDEDADADE
jgi:hypothetical protein